MFKDSYPIQTFQQAILYLVTLAAMIYSGYERLDFAVKGIENIQVTDLFEVWPVLYLFLSVPLLLIGVFISFTDPKLATKIAFVGTLFGWGYFVPSLCAGFFLVSILIFISPVGFLGYFLPGVLLLITTVYTSRAIASRS